MLQDIVPIELASYGAQLQYEREAHASGIRSSSEARALGAPPPPERGSVGVMGVNLAAPRLSSSANGSGRRPAR
jgi:hypothetical protein